MKQSLQLCFILTISLQGGWLDAAPATLTLGPYVEYVTPESVRIHWHTREPSPSYLDFGRHPNISEQL